MDPEIAIETVRKREQDGPLLDLRRPRSPPRAGGGTRRAARRVCPPSPGDRLPGARRAPGPPRPPHPDARRGGAGHAGPRPPPDGWAHESDYVRARLLDAASVEEVLEVIRIGETSATV